MITRLILLLCALLSGAASADTLGSTSTPDAATAYDSLRVWAFLAGQMPADGTLTNVSVYVDSVSGFGDQNFAVGVYKGSATFPTTFVSSAASTAVDGTPAWKTVSVSGSLTSGDYIWIAVVRENSGSNTLRVYGTGAGGSQNVRQGQTAPSYPTMPTPWSNDDTHTQNQPAGYITYTTGGGGGGTPVPVFLHYYRMMKQ